MYKKNAIYIYFAIFFVKKIIHDSILTMNYFLLFFINIFCHFKTDCPYIIVISQYRLSLRQDNSADAEIF